MDTRIIHLRGRSNQWAVSSLGGRLAGWRALDGEAWRTVCLGDPAAIPSKDAHRSIVMFPWVNRIGGDHWSCDGEPVPLNLSGAHTHLHGVVYDLPWETLEATDRRAEFRIVVEPQTYYPRRVEGRIAYEIVEVAGREALQVSLRATNLEAAKTAYVTTGIHPYFVNPYGGTADAMELTCAAEGQFELDERLIPVRLGPIRPEHDFRSPRPIGATPMDAGFTIRPGADPAATLSVGGFRLAVHVGENCGYMQVYIRPERDEIAIEPQSGGADAFRVPEWGLRRLGPGESFTWSTRMSAWFE